MLTSPPTELEVDAGDLDTDGKGRIHVKGAPDEGDPRRSTWRWPPISSTARPSPAAASS